MNWEVEALRSFLMSDTTLPEPYHYSNLFRSLRGHQQVSHPAFKLQDTVSYNPAPAVGISIEMSPSTRARMPLEDTTNEYRTPTPSPPMATAKTGPVLRRRPSERALHPHLDSSESLPSPHSSIYQATAADISTENFNWYDAREWGTPKKSEHEASSSKKPQSPSWEDNVMDLEGNIVPASFMQDTPSPKKHIPHKLFPITEQNSLATLRPGHSLATLKGQPSGTSLRPISPGLKGKKRKSFSLSDLPPTVRSESDSQPSSPPSDPLSTPIEPHKPPPIRIPTPPGLPKFNDPSAPPYHLPPPPLRFRDRFRPPNAAEREWAMQTIGLPAGVVMRGENGVNVRSRFVPPKSGHFPPQRRAHAIMRVREGTDEDAIGISPPRPVVVNRRNSRFMGPRTRPQTPATGAPVESMTIGQEGKLDKKERLLKSLHWLVGCCGGCEKLGAKAKSTTWDRPNSVPLFA